MPPATNLLAYRSGGKILFVLPRPRASRRRASSANTMARAKCQGFARAQAATYAATAIAAVGRAKRQPRLSLANAPLSRSPRVASRTTNARLFVFPLDDTAPKQPTHKPSALSRILAALATTATATKGTKRSKPVRKPLALATKNRVAGALARRFLQVSFFCRLVFGRS